MDNASAAETNLRWLLRPMQALLADPAMTDLFINGPGEGRCFVDRGAGMEQITLPYLATLTDGELKRIVTVHDRPGKRYFVDGLLWNIVIHEARHVAQISVLLRIQGVEPPFLDLLKYLPVPSA